MLDPDEGQLLHEVIRPPQGYALDYALGTTYSLDLTTLLSVPLAFTRYQYGDAELEEVDQLAVLKALQDHAGNVAIFCQAGEIHVPPVNRTIYQILEDVVIQAQPPADGGSFHPKTWTFRYVPSDDGSQHRPRYRFVCLSRNLTHARSWDTVVSLDGDLTDRQLAYSRNHPVGDFIQALPSFATTPVDPSIAGWIDTLQDEIRRVDFEPPEPFEHVDFHPLGLDGPTTWPFPDRETALYVISPFLSGATLQRFNPADRDATLISTENELNGLDPAVLGPWDAYVLDQAAEQDIQDLLDDSPDTDPDLPGEGAGTDPLRGLHAKVFHVDDGWDTRVVTGSANATNAAFNRNVEFLVELRGKKSDCGTETVLGSTDEGAALTEMLVPFSPDPDHEPDVIDERLDEVIREAKTAIIETDPSASVDDPADEDGFALKLELKVGPVTVGERTSVMVRPITLPEGSSRSLTESSIETVTFSPIELDSLTSFFAFEVAATVEGRDRTRDFVLNMPLEGAPTNRDKHLIRSIINDPTRFVQFLALLLADVDQQLGYGLAQGSFWRDDVGQGRGRDSTPVLESLLKVLHRDPDQLDRVHELLVDLRETGDMDAVVPPAFEGVFEPIWQVKEERDG